MHFVILFFTILLSSLSYGLINCPPRKALIDSSRELLRQVAIYDDIKPVDAASFAKQQGTSEKDVDFRYAATSVFTCDNAAGNGQVVVKSNMVVTVYHTFLKDRLSCSQPRQLKGCSFIIKQGSKATVIKAKRIVARGDCSPGEMLPTGNDWAVIELEKTVPKNIAPYQIPNGPALKPGQPVTLVGTTTALNLDSKNHDFLSNPKAFASCVAFGKDTFKYWGEYQSNCPSADGSSGSAVLTVGDKPIFSGLLAGDIRTRPTCLPDGAPIGEDGPFAMNCRASLLVPVEGKFLSALQSIR